MKQKLLTLFFTFIFSNCREDGDGFAEITFDVTTNRTQINCYTIAGGTNNTGLGYHFDIISGGTRVVRSADYVVDSNHSIKIEDLSPGNQYKYEIYLWCRCIDSISYSTTCFSRGYSDHFFLTEGYFTPSDVDENIIGVDLN